MAGSAEEFWNISSGSAFNFNDDYEQEGFHSAGDTFDTIHKEGIFLSNLDDESTLTTLPIHSILTKRNLDLVLDDVVMPITNVHLSIQETILKIYLGKPYMLGMYRTLHQKLELLHEAELTEDGNVIMTIVLYLRKTLKLTKLYQYLTKRKIALQHYTNYLMKQLNFEELSNLYMYNHNFADIIYLFYLECRDTSNKDRTAYKITKFLNQHQHNLSRDKELLFLDFKKFIEWQIANYCERNSVTEQLVELCETELSCNKDKKINDLKLLIKVSDFQYEWIILNTLCAFQIWPKLTSLFIKPNWLTKKSSFKSVINVELFILTMFAHDPPKTFLSEFLSCISGEDGINLARQMDCHRFIIDFYISQKDRQSIIHYKDCIPYESEDYQYVELILQAVDRKWKN